jgi:mRNA interferase MazF
MIDELKRNGSGYYDPTAYKAMKNLENGGACTMKRGEIWEVGFGKETRLMVVVSVQEKFCNTLVLNDERICEQDIAIKATAMKFTNPAMMSYAYKDRFNRFIRMMRDDELEELLAKVSEKLALPVDTELDVFEETILAEKNAEIEALKDHIKVLVEQNEEVHHSITERTVIELTVERDLYKAQYEKMLERLIGA